jgi:hypothetical protein
VAGGHGERPDEAGPHHGDRYGAVSFAVVVLLHFLVVDPFLGRGLGEVAVTAAAVFGVWVLSAWWTTR